MGTQPLPKNGRSPQFSAHVYSGQTAAWIKMPLGTEVGLALCDIVFDVDPATPRKKEHTHPHPIFDPCLLWPNGWMDDDAAWYGSRPRPRPHCTRRGPSSRKRGAAAAPPLFGPCLLWSRSPISTTAELLYIYLGLYSVVKAIHLTRCLLYSPLPVNLPGRRFG